MKKFLTAWDGKYYTKALTQTHTLSWFNKDRGYDKEHISKIKKLRVGEHLEIEKGHVIVRLA